MPHFIIDSKTVNDSVIKILDKDLYTHIVKALRAKVGEKLLLIDENEVQYHTIIQEITNKEVYTKVVDSYKSNRKLDIDITLAQSVLKPEAQFSTIQKATELGVKNIAPLLTDNCTIKESIIKAKQDKWQKIALESVKQCERADIPKVLPFQKLDKNFFNNNDNIYVAFVEKNADYSLKEFFEKNKFEICKTKFVVIIGPEGGFSDREFELFKELNIPQVTLGNLIYRADTATVVALSTLIYGLQNG